MYIRVVVYSVGHAADAEPVYEGSAALIISIYDCEFGILEHFTLCTKIILHRFMIVEMILSEVCESADRVFDAVRTVLIERLGANLHHDNIDARIAHDAEYAHKLNAFGSGMRGGYDGITNEIADGSDEPDPVAGALKDAFEHISCGCLAVGTGHTDNCYALCRLFVQLGSHLRHCDTGIWHDDLGNIERKFALNEQRSGSVLNCGFRKFMPVKKCSVDAYEEVAGDDPARIVFDAIYIDVAADEL